uniref:Uncharacterized protein n=1 Tax=Anguilla anguilla TaxID=7936 RepID=A0A0E9PQ27_ANGAN
MPRMLHFLTCLRFSLAHACVRHLRLLLYQAT